MKKFATYLLVLLMLIVTAQPTIAKHYCGGELASLSLYEDIDICGMCNMKEGHSPHKQSAQSIKPIGCCENQYIHINTDNFDKRESISMLSSTQLLSYAAVILPFLQAYYLPQTDNITDIQIRFPSKGLNRFTYNLLDFICIYRI